MSEEFNPVNLAAMKSEYQALLNDIKQIKEKALDNLKATEEARKKADDDATYAYKAKSSAEIHSKETAGFKGSAEADLSSITTSKKNLDEILAAVVVGKATIDGEMKAITENRKHSDQCADDVEKQANAIDVTGADVAKMRVACEATVAEVEKLKTAATTAATKVTDLESQIAQSSKAASTGLASIETHQGKAIELSNEISEILKSSNSDKDALDAVIKHLANSDQIATKHELRVEELIKKLAEVTKEAERLLPGVTTASLAHSFGAQKERFAEPQKRWLNTFRLCIVGLIVVAAPSFLVAVFGGLLGIAPSKDWEEILRGMVMRLPIVIPLAWLAVYAGRNYMLSLRLEEEYAYKEAISRAFEGYKREMSSIDEGDAEHQTPLNKLCVNVLNALAERPGRIYEGKGRDYTLSAEARELVEGEGEAQKARISKI